jgi:hypothetical protein
VHITVHLTEKEDAILFAKKEQIAYGMPAISTKNKIPDSRQHIPKRAKAFVKQRDTNSKPRLCENEAKKGHP